SSDLHVLRWNEHREESPQEHIDGCPRRVRDLEFIGDRDEFARIPEGSRRGNCQEIHDQRIHEYAGCNDALGRFPGHAGSWWRVGGESVAFEGKRRIYRIYFSPEPETTTTSSPRTRTSAKALASSASVPRVASSNFLDSSRMTA